MAYKLHVIYVDGRAEDIIPSPMARIETERHYGGLGPHNTQEGTFYMAWVHLRRNGSAPDTFEAWVGSLADAEETQVDVRPTQPAPSAGTSSGSVYEPDSPSQS